MTTTNPGAFALQGAINRLVVRDGGAAGYGSGRSRSGALRRSGLESTLTDPVPPSDVPLCWLCDKREPAEGYRVCRACLAVMDSQLAAILDLAVLLPAAVTPSLSQQIGRSARGRETPLPGGEALNLTAGSNAEVPLRFIPKVVITPRDFDVVVGGQPVTVTVRERLPVLDEFTGRPLLVPDGDQHGDIGPWVMVHRWVAQWVELRDVGEVGQADPEWLRERLDWACRAHPDIVAWAEELDHLVSAMRAILAIKARVVRYGNRCPDCNAAQTLFRIIDPMLPPDDPRTAYVNCGACGRLWEIDDERLDAERSAA